MFIPGSDAVLRWRRGADRGTGQLPRSSGLTDLQAEGLIATVPSARATRHQSQIERVATKDAER